MVFILFLPCLLFSEVKFLHISFHKTCLLELEYVGKKLGISIESLELLSCPKEQFDGVTLPWSLDRYLLSEEKANAIWQTNAAYFSSFDGYIVSDTTPLFQIFSQNAPDKPLILWICNRFDFSPQQDFFDTSYYATFYDVVKKTNVRAIAYTPYEMVHASRYGIPIKTLIRPIGLGYLAIERKEFNPIPPSLNKQNLFFLRGYFNEKNMKLSRLLHQLQIPHYQGCYAGPRDLKGFKGVIHIPGVMSNFALFENLSLGLTHFIPSRSFYEKLSKVSGNSFRFWCKAPFEDIFSYSEWYQKEFANLFIYFDSFEDLKQKTMTFDPHTVSKQIEAFSENHKERMLRQWADVFGSFLSPPSSSLNSNSSI